MAPSPLGTSHEDLFRLPTGLVQGSDWLPMEELYRGAEPDQWLFHEPEHAWNDGTASTSLLDDLAVRLRDWTPGKQPTVLVVGRPDIGKTALAYAVMRRVDQVGAPEGARARTRAHPTRAVVLQLSRYVTEYRRRPAYFGTRLWMRTSGPFARLPAGQRRRLALILDSLDDLAGDESGHGMELLLERPLFTDAALLTCSDGLYDKIRTIAHVRDAPCVTLEGLGTAQRRQFATRYLDLRTRLVPPGTELSPGPDRPTGSDDAGRDAGHDAAAAASRRLQQEAALAIQRDDAGGAPTFREPLHLLIGLESVARQDSAGTSPLDAYVSSTLDREVASGPRTLHLDAMLDLLGSIATLLTRFQSGPLPAGDVPAWITAPGYLTFLADATSRLHLTTEQVLAELNHCRFVRVGSGRIGLSNARFRDYFVALDIVRDFLSPRPRVPLADRFSSLLPGEVVFQLGHQLHLIRDSEELRRMVITSLWRELESATRALSATAAARVVDVHVMTVRRRIVCEQIAYYLGLAVGPGAEADTVLRTLSRHDLLPDDPWIALRNDPWIRRGLLVGLGQGGNSRALAHYVDELWQERLRHEQACAVGAGCEPGLNRRVNNEFNLVLFGDAQPRDGAPDRCLRPDGCTRTLFGMLDILETETSDDLRRLVLFIVLDLRDYHWQDGAQTKGLTQEWDELFCATPRTHVEWSAKKRLERVLDMVPESAEKEVRELRRLLAGPPGDPPPSGARDDEGGPDGGPAA